MDDNKLKRKVLITVPDINAIGGVSAVYRAARMNEDTNCSYFNVQFGKKIKYFRFLGLMIMYLLFFLKCFKFKVIHLNPSLRRNSYYREMVLILIAKLMNRKVIVYWHGWINSFEDKIKTSKIRHMLFLKTYGKVDVCIVLGSVFREKLLGLGFKNTILVESNCFDDTFLKNIRLNKSHIDVLPVRLLFLSRIEKQKGIYITIDTHNLLIKKGHKSELVIAGTGSELNAAMKYVDSEKIGNIKFTGNVEGIEKHNLLENSHILLFPSYSEGLPLTILEGMAYGLVIISRPLGGIPDIIINGENGYLTESLTAGDYVEIIEKLINDWQKYNDISERNILKAQSMFLPEKFKERLISVYNNI